MERESAVVVRVISVDSASADLEISGTLDYRSVNQIREVIDPLIAAGRKYLYLDCAQADFFDSSGIGLLARIGEAMRARGGALRVLSTGHQLRHGLEVLGLASLVDISERRQEAYLRVRKGAVRQMVAFQAPGSLVRDGQIRHRIVSLAENLPFSPDELEDIKLAVGEAITNAIRHGFWAHEKETIELKAVADGGTLEIEITNPGRPFELPPPPDPVKLEPGGLGIFFMRQCMDTVDFSFADGKVTVRMTKRLKRRYGE